MLSTNPQDARRANPTPSAATPGTAFGNRCDPRGCSGSTDRNPHGGSSHGYARHEVRWPANLLLIGYL